MHKTHIFEQKEYKIIFFTKATPIYLLVLRAQEVGNEPFWNKKKSWKMWLFLFFLFF